MLRSTLREALGPYLRRDVLRPPFFLRLEDLRPELLRDDFFRPLDLRRVELRPLLDLRFRLEDFFRLDFFLAIMLLLFSSSRVTNSGVCQCSYPYRKRTVRQPPQKRDRDGF